MKDALREYLQLAEFADELDVAKHLALGDLPTLLIFLVDAGAAGFQSRRAVVEFYFALVEQQKAEGARAFVGFEIGGFFGQALAQLCIHRRVLWLVEGLVEYEQDDAL